MAKQVEELTGASLTQAILADPDYKAMAKAVAEGKVVEEEDEIEEEKPVKQKPKKVVEDDDEDESTAAATEGGDDDGEALQEELLSLAQEHGVDPGLLEGCETVDEADRLLDKLFRVLHQQGQQQTNGHTPQTQTVEEKAIELVLDDYEENDPTRKNLEALLEDNKELRKALKGIQTAQERHAQDQAYRAQLEAENYVKSVLRENHPDIFGTDKKQSRLEKRRELQALNAAKVIAQGFAATGQQATLATIAKRAVQMEFSGELTKKANIVKREKVVARAAKRTGAPAADRQSTEQPDEPQNVPMSEDKSLLRAIKQVRRGQLAD